MKVKGLRIVAFVNRQVVHKAVHQLRALRSVALHHFGPLALGQVPFWAVRLLLQAAPDACCAQRRAEIHDIRIVILVTLIVQSPWIWIAQCFTAGLKTAAGALATAGFSLQMLAYIEDLPSIHVLHLEHL